MSWALSLSLVGLLFVAVLAAVCAFARWHSLNYRRIPYRRLDVTCGQFKDYRS